MYIGDDGNNPSYELFMSYEYDVAGQQYVGRARSEWSPEILNLPLGGGLVAFYDPAHPEISLPGKNGVTVNILFHVLGGLVMLALAVASWIHD